MNQTRPGVSNIEDIADSRFCFRVLPSFVKLVGDLCVVEKVRVSILIIPPKDGIVFTDFIFLFVWRHMDQILQPGEEDL